MTYEREPVARALLRASIEQAIALAEELGDSAKVRLLEEALDNPTRIGIRKRSFWPGST